MDSKDDLKRGLREAFYLVSVQDLISDFAALVGVCKVAPRWPALRAQLTRPTMLLDELVDRLAERILEHVAGDDDQCVYSDGQFGGGSTARPLPPVSIAVLHPSRVEPCEACRAAWLPNAIWHDGESVGGIVHMADCALFARFPARWSQP